MERVCSYSECSALEQLARGLLTTAELAPWIACVLHPCYGCAAVLGVGGQRLVNTTLYFFGTVLTPSVWA